MRLAHFDKLIPKSVFSLLTITLCLLLFVSPEIDLSIYFILLLSIMEKSNTYLMALQSAPKESKNKNEYSLIAYPL